jgi:signal transduction histidine kinase
MKLRTRLSLFTGIIIVALVGGVSLSILHLLQKVFLAEVHASQETVLKNFSRVCEESLVLRDPVIIVSYAESLDKSFPGLSYAVFAHNEFQRVFGENAKFQEFYPYFSHALEAASGNQVLRSPKGELIQELSAPIMRGGSSAGMVRVGFNQKYVDSTVAEKVVRVQGIVFLVAGISLVLAVLATLVMSAQITRPLNKLATGAKAIGEGNLDTQIHVGRNDELGFLAHEFNIMAIRLKELDQLKDEFVSSVSHELRSPLAAISGYVELMTRKPLEQIPVEKRTKAFNIILDSTTRLTQLSTTFWIWPNLKRGVWIFAKPPSPPEKRWRKPWGCFSPYWIKNE